MSEGHGVFALVELVRKEKLVVAGPKRDTVTFRSLTQYLRTKDMIQEKT